MTKRLLFVVNVDWFFISHRLPIALAALEQGYDVHLATGITDGEPTISSMGIMVHPLSLDRSGTNIIMELRLFWRLISLFRQLRPDVVHLITIKPVLFGGIAARLACIQAVVAAVSGLGSVFVGKGIHHQIVRFFVMCLYKFAFALPRLRVIFQNPDDRDCLTRMTALPFAKTVLIHGSGVDLQKYVVRPFPKGDPIVVLAARMLVNKGVREFVEAARIVKRQGARVRFCLVGAPDPENPASISEEELRFWQQHQIVEFWGHRTDMPEVIASSTLVVLPSYYREGMPKVLLEAAACGRPVVTTDEPGCRDAIEPGKTGLLVPARDATALAEALQNLLADPARCVAMGLAARDLAEARFDVRHVVAEHLRIYKELLEEP